MDSQRGMDDNFVPYAPFSGVIDVIRRYRDRGLPDPLTAQTLETVGVSPSMTGVVFRALVFLKLVDEGGNKTEAFERLRKATSDEYDNVLAEIVRSAYVTVFTIVDPSEDDKVAVDDAFRRYEPANQRSKMVRLFLGLCEEAGIIAKKPRQVPTRMTRPRNKDDKEKVAERQVAAPKTAESNSPASEKQPDAEKADIAPTQRLISAIFQQLPSSGKWTVDKRKKWLDAMTSAIDLVIEVQPNDPVTPPTTGS